MYGQGQTLTATEPERPDKQAASARALAACRLFAVRLKGSDHKATARAFWDAASLLWSEDDFYWNEWSHQIVLDLIMNRRMAILGAKQSGKSTTVMAFALVLYWGAWKRCSVIYRTTTLDAAEQRGWGEFVRLMEAAKTRLILPGVYQRAKPPRFIPSSESGDKKNAILCMPTKAQAEGSNKTAQSGIKGFHTEYQLLIDDEANEMPDGIEDAPAALDAEWKVFRYVAIGNPNSWLNPLGRVSAPSEIKRSALYEKNAPNRWKINGGVAIRLNAYESPNIVRGRKPNGEWPYKHMPTPATIEIQLAQCSGDENHPLMWQFIRALPPPDDSTAAILTHALVSQMRADQPADFVGEPTLGAGLDPAFTAEGDDCILRFARWGICRDGVWRVEYLDKLIIPVSAEDEQDAFYQVAMRVKKACTARSIQPWNFAFDCSGTGMGIKSFFVREWSPKVHPVDFLGKPSKLRVVANPTAKEMAEGKVTGLDYFDRRVSEVYFTLRYFVEHDQVRGLFGQNEIIINQGSQRKYFSENGKLSVISKKTQYNKNTSCDDLDAACVICDLLKHRGFLPGGTMANKQSIQQQIQDQIQEHASAIPQMAGQKNESHRLAMDALRQVAPSMFTQTHDEMGVDGFAFDESQLGSGF